LSYAETLSSTPGEIADFIACHAIESGAKQKNRVSTEDALLKVR